MEAASHGVLCLFAACVMASRAARGKHMRCVPRG